MKRVLVVLPLCVCCAVPVVEPPRGDLMREGQTAGELHEAIVTSSLGGATQRALVYFPSPDLGPVPLLVLLHTWSGDYTQRGLGLEQCLEQCKLRGWALIHPDFRGPNRRPQACASDLAVGDVLDAVTFVRGEVEIDPARIYVAGTSGGGHMALVMAARAPDLWAGVSAWVPVTDLAAWHAETSMSEDAGHHRYAAELEAVCGGAPGDSPDVDEQYRVRSPLSVLSQAAGLPVDINAGAHDGHTGSVPISHSLRAFNILARANGHTEAAFSEEEVLRMAADPGYASSRFHQLIEDPAYLRKVLLRRAAGAVRLTLFDGGHEGDPEAAVEWLASQRRP